jgi:hypothetical protein
VARASRIVSAASSGPHLTHATLFGPGSGKSGWSVISYRGVTMTSIPGADLRRWWLAKSTSACDTPRMNALSRALRRWDPARIAVLALGLALVLCLGAFGVVVATSTLTIGPAVAALALVGIAGIGLLYAWRLGAGVVD